MTETALDARFLALLPTALSAGIGLDFVKLLAAVLAGGVIGFDREVKGRAAGLRTHMLVALAAATTAVLALDLSAKLYAANPNVNADPLRIIEGLVAAVGFIGGGIIIRSGGRIRGLTTASSLWICGMVGLAYGAGYFALATITLAIAFTVLVLLSWVEVKLGTKRPPDKPAADPGDDPVP